MATTRLAVRRTPILPVTSHNVAPVILTARQLLTTHPALADRLRAAGRQLLLVGAWDRLLVGVEKAVVDVVLVDMDAADRSRAGRQRISGHRLVALLARRLAEQARTRATPGARLAVLTRLDYAEIEDLVRLGIHILGRPDHDPDTLVGRLCGGQAPTATPSGQAATKAVPEHARIATPSLAPVERSHLPELVWQKIAIVIAATSPVTTADTRKQRVSDRAVIEGLCHMLRTGGGWATYPPTGGAPSTARRRLQRWRAAGVFIRLAALALEGDMAMQELLALPWTRLGGTAGVDAHQPAYEVAQICKQ
ncbi:MAG TPA: transposase [Ktedonobacterales bacterium]|nr:transposase [Ktedonobacterales bacterium]